MKYALVTGGASGLGIEISLWLAKKGYNIAVVYHTSLRNLKKMEDQFDKLGIDYQFICTDLTNESAYLDIFKIYKNKWKSIDLLINNAGVFPKNAIETIKLKDWDDTFAVNLKSVFFISKWFSKIMKEGGNIINISSLGGLEIWNNRLLYNVSKSAQITLTKSMAREFSPKIRVNSIAPGEIETVNKKKYFDKNRLPLLKNIEKEDVFNCIEFLINTHTITGVTIPLESGKLLI